MKLIPYASVAGSFNEWSSLTRFDIAYATSLLGTLQSTPRLEHSKVSDSRKLKIYIYMINSNDDLCIVGMSIQIL